MSKTFQDRMSEGRQYRELDLKIPEPVAGEPNRFGSTHYVEGYALTFERYPLTTDSNGDDVYELFTASSFDNTDMTDIIFQLNHEGRVYARMSNNTLFVERDEHGLKICADLSRTASSREIYEDINTGLLTKMSWGFKPQDYSYDKDTKTIIHKSIKKIYDVSAVSIPANDGTEITARSFVNGELDRIKADRLKLEALQLDLDIELERNK